MTNACSVSVYLLGERNTLLDFKFVIWHSLGVFLYFKSLFRNGYIQTIILWVDGGMKRDTRDDGLILCSVHARHSGTSSFAL